MKIKKEEIKKAVAEESARLEVFYAWLEAHMPPSFFQEVPPEHLLLIAHTLMHLDVQDFFSHIHLKDGAFALCLDGASADLNVLGHYRMRGIKTYRAFVSNAPPPFPHSTLPLRIVSLHFTSFYDALENTPEHTQYEEAFTQLKQKHPELSREDFLSLISSINARFLRGLTKERLVLALDMFCRAKTRDSCQYELRYIRDWKEKIDAPSLQIVFAWKNVPKHDFLYKMAKMIHRHKLCIKRVSCTYTAEGILIMSIGLHGAHGKAAWEEADIADFLREFVQLRSFYGMDAVDKIFVDSGLVSGNMGSLIKTMISFTHQMLVHKDPHMYALLHIEEGLCRHPELTVLLTKAFAYKFDPEQHDLEAYKKSQEEALKLIGQLDTGQESNDTRRKNILKQAVCFIEHTLKTNFYRNNKMALCFRLDPAYLDHMPYDRKEKFPQLPFAIFFMKGMYFIGFHIRFKDLSRGGLRTVFPEKLEQMRVERNHVFSECYNLAYTQQKKNKDIPEGGAKGIILLDPYERMHSEDAIYEQEMIDAGLDPLEIEKRKVSFLQNQKIAYLYQAQKAYIESFMTLINCTEDGTLKAKHVIDYWKKPEYIYLGPDENMHSSMIIWISQYSERTGYTPGSCFISSKPGSGINHKEYGVTSLGVNVCMEEVLYFLGIDPKKKRFTVKMSGGPDGDVAGNQILNLRKHYPHTAQLVALTDVSGTIFDPEGLDLEEMESLFYAGRAIRTYPPEKLSNGGFLLDLKTKKEEAIYSQQTLLWKKENGALRKEWLSGSEMNHLFRHNLHKTYADIFIPAGGRPKTLNDNNWEDFLDTAGRPSAKAIVEGANLYLTPYARRSLEKLGVLIIKDSSANKGGVICSSNEVLSKLVLSDAEFLEKKALIVDEILEIIKKRARAEAQLLLRAHQETGDFLTDLSEKISEQINGYMYAILSHLETHPLTLNKQDPYIRCLFSYCPPLLSHLYPDRILEKIPDVHKKAMIACHIASRLVYQRGLQWHPSIIEVLPLLIQDEKIISD